MEKKFQRSFEPSDCCTIGRAKAGFLGRFRDPIRVPRIKENYYRVPEIREDRVPWIS